MHPMRRLALLTEAKTPKSAPLSHQQRVQQEQDRQAQTLVRLQAQAAALKAQVAPVIESVHRSIWRIDKWDKEWTGEVRNIVKANYAAGLAAAKEEFEWERENNPDSPMPTVNFAELLIESFAKFWDAKRDRLDWQDADYRLNDYMDAHRKTEQSDDMSRLQAEHHMLTHIRHYGGFGSAEEMERTLALIGDGMHDLGRHMDGGWSSVGSTTLDIVCNGIPLILLYCNSIAAIKPLPV